METQAGERGTLRREAGEGRVVNTVMRKDQSSHRKKKRRTKEKKKKKEEEEKREKRVECIGATGKFGSFLIEFPSLS